MQHFSFLFSGFSVAICHSRVSHSEFCLLKRLFSFLEEVGVTQHENKTNWIHSKLWTILNDGLN